MGLVIATILIAYILVLTFSNWAIAQASNQRVIHSISFVTTVPESLQATVEDLHGIGSTVMKDEAQAGKILEGQQGSHHRLGCSPLDPRGC